MMQFKLVLLITFLITVNYGFGQEEINVDLHQLDSNWTFTHSDTSINDIGTISIRFSDSMIQDGSSSNLVYVGEDNYVENILVERHRIIKDGFKYRAYYDASNGDMTFINLGKDSDNITCVIEFFENGRVAIIEHFLLSEVPSSEVLNGLKLQFDEAGNITKKQVYSDGILIIEL